MKQREDQFSYFELWPGWLFNIPLVLWWLLLSLRFRSVTLPTICNPKLPMGGLCGESKEELFSLLGTKGKQMLAPYVVIRTGTEHEGDLRIAEDALLAAHLMYPVVAKPDMGMNGTGVQRVLNATELKDYLQQFPRGSKLMLQKLVEDPGEAGVFYVRMPNDEVGKITSVTLKHFPEVVGDGHSTLRELILKDARAARISELYFKRHKTSLSLVPEAGQNVSLVSVGNHVKGARFTNGEKYITPEMIRAFDELSKEIPEFRYGRYDVRFKTLEHLMQGEFTIIEYNGASSEPTHIWDKDAKLFDAYRSYFHMLYCAFKLGDYYRSKGYKPAGVVRTLQAFRREARDLRTYPQGLER